MDNSEVEDDLSFSPSMEAPDFDFLWGNRFAAWWVCKGRRPSGDVHQRGADHTLKRST
jgi:hypothetical protein